MSSWKWKWSQVTLGQLSTYESAQERKETSHASHQRRYQSQGNHSLESPSLQFGVHHMITGFCFVLFLTKSYFISNDRASWGWRCLCKTAISVHNRYCHVAMCSQQDLSVQQSLSPSWYSCAFSIIISPPPKKTNNNNNHHHHSNNKNPKQTNKANFSHTWNMIYISHEKYNQW